jgi:Holliday junction resolvase
MRLLCDSGVDPMTNSNLKGKNGEREWANFLREHGIGARRGQQFCGGKDSPDVVSDLENIHWECKRVEAGNPYVWLEQAISNTSGSGAKIPVVAHRRNNQEWIVILRADDFLNFILPGATSDKEP